MARNEYNDQTRTIATYYFDHNHKRVKTIMSVHANAAVSNAQNSLRLKRYWDLGVTSATVFDTVSAKEYATIRRNKRTGKLEIEDFTNPRDSFDPVRRTILGLLPPEAFE